MHLPSLVCAMIGVAAASLCRAQEALPRLPYLQVVTPNAVTVRWRTGTPTQGRVWYGSRPDALTSFVEGSVPGTEHEVRVLGLQPNTKYYYGVGDADGVVSGGDAQSFFVTSPLPGRAKRTRIWALGDSGTGAAGQMETRDAYYAYTGKRGTDLLMLLGDNAYGSGYDEEYQANFFNIYPSLLKNTPIWPTIGNHETVQSPIYDPEYPYYKNFTMPTSGEAGGVPSGTERYYSANYGNIHLVCLDSMTSDRSANGAMAAWLRADLASTTARWVIAFWHHPAYSKGGHDSDTEGPMVEMRENLVPILEEYGVDLVLAGHSHVWERSWLMTGHIGDSTTFDPSMRRSGGLGRPGIDGAYVKNAAAPGGGQGTVYIVAGSAAGLYFTTPHPALPVALARLGTAVIDVQGDRLEVKFLRETGAIDDWFTMIKPWSAADTDGDGMPDDFEREYGMNPNSAADAAQDLDQDGANNLQEFRAGTDPTERDSKLVASMANPGGGIAVRFSSAPGRRYVIERCTDLASENWMMFANNIEGTGDEVSIRDPSPPAAGAFYRVKIQP